MNKMNPDYAKMRIEFYGICFQKQTITQLVNNFNRLASSRGWTAERSYYSAALTHELLRREIDLSNISKTDANGKLVSVRYGIVLYDEGQKKLILKK